MRFSLSTFQRDSNDALPCLLSSILHLAQAKQKLKLKARQKSKARLFFSYIFFVLSLPFSITPTFLKLTFESY